MKEDTKQIVSTIAWMMFDKVFVILMNLMVLVRIVKELFLWSQEAYDPAAFLPVCGGGAV